MRTAFLIFRDLAPLFIAFVAGLYIKDAQRQPPKIFTRRECITIALVAITCAVLMTLNNRYGWLV